MLYANTADGENVIVSIVSREGEQVMAIEFPEDASLQSRKGSISVAAERSVSLSSAKLNMLSETMVQKTGDAYLEVQEMHAQGERLNANFSRIMVLSNFISTIAKQAVNKFMTYMRRSENFDQVKAANMTRSSDGLYSVNSKQTVMLSEKDTRIDAERIHIG